MRFGISSSPELTGSLGYIVGTGELKFPPKTGFPAGASPVLGLKASPPLVRTEFLYAYVNSSSQTFLQWLAGRDTGLFLSLIGSLVWFTGYISQ